MKGTLWLSKVPAMGEADRERLRAMLDEKERERHLRFRFERDRDLFLTAHVLARHALSVHTGAPAHGFRFTEGEHGRPRLLEAANVDFNLTHTQGLAACVVGPAGVDFGVDAEFLPRRGELMSVAERYFNPDELRVLQGLASEDEQRFRFLSFWVLKEAYVKARGIGLGLPLHALTCAPPPVEGDARIAMGPELSDDHSRWSHRVWKPTDEHLVAVSAKSLPLEITVRWSSPVEL